MPQTLLILFRCRNAEFLAEEHFVHSAGIDALDTSAVGKSHVAMPILWLGFIRCEEQTHVRDNYLPSFNLASAGRNRVTIRQAALQWRSCNVGVQMLVFRFHTLTQRIHHIADGNNPAQLPVCQDWEVADMALGHSVHHVTDVGLRRGGDDVNCHEVTDLCRCQTR